MTGTDRGPSRTALAAAWAVGVLVGLVVGVLTSDVILGIIAGAPCVVIGVGLLRVWTGGDTSRTRHP